MSIGSRFAGLCLALALLAGTERAGRAEPERSQSIDQLIAQLGSNDFRQREKASAELDRLGHEALGALRKAAQSDDPETSRRARALVSKMERRVTAQRVLVPRRIHLVCKEKPLGAVLEELGRRSGYSIQLIDPEGKLKDRKVTLDAAEASFWHVLGLVCKQAELVEATAQELPAIRPLPRRGQPRLQIQGVQPANPPVIPQAVPVPAAPAGPNAGSIQVQIQIQVQPNPGGVPGPQPAVQGVFIQQPGFPQTGLERPIYLKAGKSPASACADSTSLRIRESLTHPVAGQPLPDNLLNVALEVRVEPRLELRSLGAVRIEKAVDDQGQELSQEKGPAAALPGAAFRPMIAWRGMDTTQTAQVFLSRGEKEAKSLALLKGVVSAHVFTEDQPLVTVDNVLEATGKTIQGEGNTSIKLLDVKETTEKITVRVELRQAPQQQRQPGVPRLQAPLPGQPAAPQIIPPAQGAVWRGRVGGPVMVGGFGMNTRAWSFRDEKDRSLPCRVTFLPGLLQGADGASLLELTWQKVEGEAKPFKLVYSTLNEVEVDVPFSLRNISLERK